MEKRKRKALVVEGGAMRGIFGAGVLDAFMRENFNPFDLYIGVSAGSSATAAYLADMPNRTFKVVHDYCTRKEFLDWGRFIFGGDLVDIDWLWDITMSELGIDFDTLYANNPDFIVPVTSIETGECEYKKPTREDLVMTIKASSSLPHAYRKFVSLDGKNYSDGGISDSIPVKKAHELGADEIMVIRSRVKDWRFKGGFKQKMLANKFKKYPGLRKALLKRPEIYNEAIDFMRNPPKNVKIQEVFPPDEFKTGRLTMDKDVLMDDYMLGIKAGEKAIKDWNAQNVFNV